MEFVAPFKTSIRVVNPAPAKPPAPVRNAAPAPEGNSMGGGPAAPTPVSNEPPPQVLQQYQFEYRLFVAQQEGEVLKYGLIFPFAGGEENAGFQHATLSIEQENFNRNGHVHDWHVQVLFGAKARFQTFDGGPVLQKASLFELRAVAAELSDGTFNYEHGRLLSVYPAPWDEQERMYVVGSVRTEYTMLEVTIGLERRFTKSAWNYFTCKREPQPKCALLESAERTGDVVLVGGEGVEVPAHSAILIDVPYFEAKLRDEWSGNTPRNPHNKLRLQLPCPVMKDALNAFLKYVYGDTRSLYKIEPWSAALLQDVLSLADACDVPALCADVIGLVVVTSANVDSWLEWLLKEHGVDASPIRKQVVQIMKDKLQNGLRWEDLTAEQLSKVAALQKSLACKDSPLDGQ